MSIEDNVKTGVAARNAYRKVREQILTELGGEVELSNAALSRLADIIHEKLGSTPAEEPGAMNEWECKQFEKRRMEFGQFEGERIARVPLGYLLYLDNSDFYFELRRYLKHPDIQRQQEELSAYSRT